MIKKIVFLAVFIVMLTTGTLTTGLVAQQFDTSDLNQNGVLWSTNFAAAQDQARRENKTMLLFFEGEQQNTITLSLLYNTFSKNTVYNHVNSDFVAVRIRGNQELLSQFNVIRYPTVVLFDVQADNIVGRVSGIMSTENVIALLNKNPNSNIARRTDRNDRSRSTNRSDRNIDKRVIRGTNTVATGRVTYKGGDFLYLGEDKWLHKTPFYEIEYRAFNEDSGYYFLANEQKDVLVAIPKNKNKNTSSIWIWENDNWNSIGRAEVIEKVEGSYSSLSSNSTYSNTNDNINDNVRSFYLTPNTSSDNTNDTEDRLSFDNNNRQQSNDFDNNNRQQSNDFDNNNRQQSNDFDNNNRQRSNDFDNNNRQQSNDFGNDNL